MRVLTVNTGSTSVRLAVYQCADDAPRSVKSLRVEAGDDQAQVVLEDFLNSLDEILPDGVAHRVVHGGENLVNPARVDDPDGTVRAEIQRLTSLAPLHNARALRWMSACDVVVPGVPQVAVFDTAWYASLPEVARHYALSRELVDRLALRRFGFHGIAHQAMVRTVLAGHANPDSVRVISLQLGGGCSLTASRGGKAVDTTMGFSPLEGLVMASRSGDVDPGLVTWLCSHGMSPAEVDALLNQQSGLLGMAGSADLGELLKRDDGEARLAVDLYVYRARKALGAALVLLGGADIIVFGGGVGEHLPEVRARILADLDWAGIRLDSPANETARGGAALLSEPGSPVVVRVVEVDEGAILAEAACAAA